MDTTPLCWMCGQEPARYTVKDYTIDNGVPTLLATHPMCARCAADVDTITLARIIGGLKEASMSRLRPLSEAMRHDYLETRGQVCPFCHSRHITKTDLETEDDQATESVTCDDCGQRWVATYILATIDNELDFS